MGHKTIGGVAKIWGKRIRCCRFGPPRYPSAVIQNRGIVVGRVKVTLRATERAQVNQSVMRVLLRCHLDRRRNNERERRYYPDYSLHGSSLSDVHIGGNSDKKLARSLSIAELARMDEPRSL